ncbi:MAG: lipoprotein [Sphingomonadales bacterium]|nr:lipoprotein [Sphingomonadales bacterium]
MIARLALIIAMALAISACGRKGDLVAPSSATNDSQNVETHVL